jgi:hypothetical protein
MEEKQYKNLFKHVLIVSSLLSISIQAAPDLSTISPRKIELLCGQHTVTITCGKVIDPDYPEDTRQCNHNTLSFTGSDGKVVIPSSPKGFDTWKTPVSMACNQGKDGRYYVTVEFSNCAYYVQCMTYHLFKSNGKRLTADLTDRMSQFGSVGKKLGISSYAKHIYIEGEPK